MNKNRKIDVNRMVELYHELNGNHLQISLVLGCSREYVRQNLSVMGFNATGAKHPEIINKAKETAKLVQSLSKKEAIEVLGTTPCKLNTLLKDANVKLKKHANLKYTNEFIIDLYNKYNGHYSKMANELGIPQPCISRLMKNRGLNQQYPSKGRNK